MLPRTGIPGLAERLKEGASSGSTKSARLRRETIVLGLEAANVKASQSATFEAGFSTDLD